jgi:ubiquinone/menaquinone biosynthesis C-methylase UbiE
MPSLSDASVDAILCGCVLEHVDDVQAAVRECWRVLTPGGVFFVGVPFNQPLHKVPQDFWRFTEFGIRYLLRAFVIRDLLPIGDDARYPTMYWTRAFKPLAAREVAS